MTYDVVLWKSKAKPSDSAGLIAMTLSEGYQCKAVSRFPKSKVVQRLQELLDCPIDELPFEINITGQGAIFGLPHGEALERQCGALIELAKELDLYLYDFQEDGQSEADVEEFQRRVLEQDRSEEEQTFVFALESAGKGSQYHMHFVGSCYRYGTGVMKNLSKAVEWYERGAKSGMAKALVSLAEMYREDLGDESSLQEGLGCLRRAVTARSPAALAMLAEWTRDGVGIVADLTASVALWRQLVEVDACVAGFELAKAYENGHGVDRSTILAIDYYRRSREAGHPEAYINLRRLGAEK